MESKETVEEDAKIFVNNTFTKQIIGDEVYPDIYASKESIILSHVLFANWQAERMYNEEDMVNFGWFCREKSLTDVGLLMKQFKEQRHGQ